MGASRIVGCYRSGLPHQGTEPPYRTYETPVQRSNCFGLGHIKSACSKSACSGYCGTLHNRNTCTTDVPHSSKCGKNHEFMSRQFNVYVAVQEISDYRSTHNVDYPTAKIVVASTVSQRLQHAPSQVSVHLRSRLPLIERITPSFLEHLQQYRFSRP